MSGPTAPARSAGSGPRGALRVLGLGAAACAACCVGPVVAFLSSIGLAGAVSTPVTGAVGVLVALLAGGVALALRRRRRAGCAVPAGPTPVADPVRTR